MFDVARFFLMDSLVLFDFTELHVSVGGKVKFKGVKLTLIDSLLLCDYAELCL